MLSFDVVFAEFKVIFRTQQRMLNIIKTETKLCYIYLHGLIITHVQK